MTAPTPEPAPQPQPVPTYGKSIRELLLTPRELRELATPMMDTSAVTGRAVITVRREDGSVRSRQEVSNVITDSGDQYNCRRIAADVLPVDLADVTTVSGMKLGTGVLAPSKNGAGAVLGTYVPGSNRPFDAGYPTVESLGAGLGWTITYQCTFGANVGTAAALTEIVMVLDAGTNATSDAASTIARLIFAATPKGATDTMEIQWSHKQLGTVSA